MINLHHAHLMASDIDATIAFWRDGFGARVVHDGVFAGARYAMAEGPDRLLLEIFQPDPRPCPRSCGPTSPFEDDRHRRKR